MRVSAFKEWLAANYSPNSAATHYSGAKRVEEAYSDLDELYDNGGLADVIANLNYSTADASAGRPNPSKLQAGANIYTNLASFKSAVRCYAKFRDQGDELSTDAIIELAAANILEQKQGKLFELEAHLQIALRSEITQLERGLTVVDGGFERSVSSGEIDILARDAEGALVVIELKRGLARRDTIGQITGYMGDLMVEEPGQGVRGIIVAGDFDKSCLGAVRAIPNLSIQRYRFAFTFEDIHTLPTTAMQLSENVASVAA